VEDPPTLGMVEDPPTLGTAEGGGPANLGNGGGGRTRLPRSAHPKVQVVCTPQGSGRLHTPRFRSAHPKVQVGSMIMIGSA